MVRRYTDLNLDVVVKAGKCVPQCSESTDTQTQQQYLSYNTQKVLTVHNWL